ncbi:MAG: hypothetical protein JWR78_1489 [Mycobacterium sp.]|jgi:hypothetical protein|nr:hypothetical protein [Mycobacterium sp.]
MEDCAIQTASQAVGCPECILDASGAHVLGDRPPGDPREEQSILDAGYMFPRVPAVGR